MSYQTVLLPSHNTQGAQAAEDYVFNQCRPERILHLTVVPDFWRGMVGHDWLNNKASTVAFSKYLDNQLQEDIHNHTQRLEKTASEKGIIYEQQLMMGSPIDCLLQTLDKNTQIDAVVLGSPRPKGHSGLRSKMLHRQVISKMRVPLIIIPHPHA